MVEEANKLITPVNFIKSEFCLKHALMSDDVFIMSKVNLIKIVHP